MGTDPRLPGLTPDPRSGDAVSVALPADDGSSRRAFLTKVAVGGAALTVGSQLVPATRLVPVSGAQEGDEVTLDDDEAQSHHLAGIALAANQVYRSALDGPATLPESVAQVIRAFGAHHSQQATTLATLLPAEVALDSITPSPELLGQHAAAVEGATTPEDVLRALRDLEESVAASQFAALGAIEAQNDARTVATLLPTSAQRATVLGSLAGQGLDEVLPPTQDDARALAPSGDATATGGSDETSGDAPSTAPGGDGADGGQDGTGQTGAGTETAGGGATDDDPGTTEG